MDTNQDPKAAKAAWLEEHAPKIIANAKPRHDAVFVEVKYFRDRDHLVYAVPVGHGIKTRAARIHVNAAKATRRYQKQVLIPAR